MDLDPNNRRPVGSSFSYLLFLAFMFFVMNGGSNDPTYQRTLAAAINRRTLQRARFSDWLYGNYTADVHLPHVADEVDANEPARIAEANGTFALPVLREAAVDRLVEPLVSVSGRSLYQRNVTGFLRGEWKPLNVSLPPFVAPEPVVNQTEGETPVDMSWEKQRGLMPWLDDHKLPKKASLNVRETRDAQADADIAFLRGNLEFQADDSSARLDVEGVHFQSSGRIYLIARPEEYFVDIRALPSLLSDKEESNRTAQAVLHELDLRIEKMTESFKAGTQATGDADLTIDVASNCSFAIFGKLSPEKRLNGQELAEWEANVERPNGASVLEPLPVSMNAIAYSANCGLVLEIKNAKSLLMDRFWSKALNYAGTLAVVAVTQIFLLVAQMESTTTAATLARVSYWTVSMQVGMDAYIFVTHLTLGVVTDNRASLPLLLPSFLLCLSSLLFGLRYAASIRVATAPARPTPAPAAPGQAAAAAAARRQNVSGDEEVPALASAVVSTAARAGAWSADSPIWIAIPLGVVITIVVLLATFGWVVVTVTALYSYWIPQIYANADRDASRRTLQSRYIVGTALCRLFLPLYVWACPDNVLFAQTSPWVYGLIAYQALQVTVLLLQDYLGPRFFLPRGIFPPRERWNYHPLLPPHDLEAPGGRVQDCIICLEPIDLPNKEESESKAQWAISRFSYMVPPCHHIAHTRCLESWLAVKSECPVCRRSLPAL